MEYFPVNNSPFNPYSVPDLRRIILKFIVYIIAYIIIPICLYTWIIEPIILASISKQIIPIVEIRILVKLVIVITAYKIYKWVIANIFGRLQFNLKNEWINYLTFKGLKVRYYKFMTLWLTALNEFFRFVNKISDYLDNVYMFVFKFSGVALITLLYFLVGARISAYYMKNIIEFNVLESTTLLNYLKGFNSDLAYFLMFLFSSAMIASGLLFFLGLIFCFIAILLMRCMFPVEENRIDTLDYPVTFIKNAIEELELFDFSDNALQKQSKKDKTTELISYALNFFIKVDNGNKNPDYSNFCYILWSGHLSKAAKNDVLFRTNGLYKEMDALCIKINNMKSPDERDVICAGFKKISTIYRGQGFK